MDGGGFDEFFEVSCGFAAFPYQRRLAELDCPPDFVRIPTGMGKTEALTCAWLWGIGGRGWARTPRRLVWCLPMRTLVEQTRDRLALILERACPFLGIPTPRIHVLMGGEDPGDWAVDPTAAAVLIGTQDMLLSRALNRGYGSSRYRWPMEFGLVHSDALWVFDEVQLMGAGAATTAQLEAFRRALGNYGTTRSVWMSATLRKEWLATIDLMPMLPGLEVLAIDDDDRRAAAKRLEAVKRPVRWAEGPIKSGKPGVVSKEGTRLMSGAAKRVIQDHEPGSLSILIANTVKRARDYHEHVMKEGSAAEVILLHSRFRAADRTRILGVLLRPPPLAGRILIATQVIEAGVDLDARLLVSEVAPWSSLVQRLGRLNRRGEWRDSVFGWIDLDEGLAAPYSAADLEAARAKLRDVIAAGTASPDRLPEVEDPPAWDLVIRRRELLELFDTEPDLSGADLDVSRFIRASDERDVLVFWRALEHEKPPDELRPIPEEICRVPIGALRDLLSDRAKLTKGGIPAWIFDHLEGSWRRVAPSLDGVVPGRAVCLDCELGGYDPERGWVGTVAMEPVAELSPTPAGPHLEPEWAAGDEPRSYAGDWVTLAEHADAVVEALDRILAESKRLRIGESAPLRIAARWHDRGKAHPVFQDTLLGGCDAGEREKRAGSVWAKTASATRTRHSRPGFRHELASALAMIEAGQDDLAAYLAASHHGKLRMGIRSLPGEFEAAHSRGESPERIARGICEGDVLPPADLGGEVRDPERTLSLSVMEMGLDADGRPSWQDRAERLLEQLGPFRLAFLEALLRAADVQGTLAASTSQERDDA